MISPISTLEKKVIELENNILELSSSKEESEPKPSCICINKNFSNLEVILTKRTLVSKISLNEGANLFFQGQVKVNSSNPQEVVFTLQANQTSIQKVTSNLNPGENIIQFFCNFIPISTEKISIYLKIEPKDQKPIYLQDASLFIWGTLILDDEIKYQGLELNDKYLISTSYFQTIYYKIVDKSTNEFLPEDLDEFNEGISYSFVYKPETETLYLLRVSANNDLFFSKLGDPETYLMPNISAVSACNHSGKIRVFIINEGLVYTFEIDENGNYSSPTKVNFLNLMCKDVYAYVSDKSDKIYLCITDINNSNYLLEQITESKDSVEKLKATYKIEFFTSGEKL